MMARESRPFVPGMVPDGRSYTPIIEPVSVAREQAVFGRATVVGGAECSFDPEPPNGNTFTYNELVAHDFCCYSSWAGVVYQLFDMSKPEDQRFMGHDFDLEIPYEPSWSRCQFWSSSQLAQMDPSHIYRVDTYPCVSVHELDCIDTDASESFPYKVRGSVTVVRDGVPGSATYDDCDSNVLLERYCDGDESLATQSINCGMYGDGWYCSGDRCVEDTCNRDCEDNGYDCGMPTICGETINCGGCTDNPEFGTGYICDNNKCVPEEEGVEKQCADGLDNDGDGLVDMDDPGCSSSTDDSEVNGGGAGYSGEVVVTVKDHFLNSDGTYVSTIHVLNDYDGSVYGLLSAELLTTGRTSFADDELVQCGKSEDAQRAVLLNAGDERTYYLTGVPSEGFVYFGILFAGVVACRNDMWYVYGLDGNNFLDYDKYQAVGEKLSKYKPTDLVPVVIKYDSGTKTFSEFTGSFDVTGYPNNCWPGMNEGDTGCGSELELWGCTLDLGKGSLEMKRIGCHPEDNYPYCIVTHYDPVMAVCSDDQTGCLWDGEKTKANKDKSCCSQDPAWYESGTCVGGPSKETEEEEEEEEEEAGPGELKCYRCYGDGTSDSKIFETTNCSLNKDGWFSTKYYIYTKEQVDGGMCGTAVKEGVAFVNPNDEDEWCVSKGDETEEEACARYSFPRKYAVPVGEISKVKKNSVGSMSDSSDYGLGGLDTAFLNWKKLDDADHPVCWNDFGDAQCVGEAMCLPAQNNPRTGKEDNLAIYEKMKDIIGIGLIETEGNLELFGACVPEKRDALSKVKGWVAGLIGWEVDDPDLNYVIFGGIAMILLFIYKLIMYLKID